MNWWPRAKAFPASSVMGAVSSGTAGIFQPSHGSSSSSFEGGGGFTGTRLTTIWLSPLAPLWAQATWVQLDVPAGLTEEVMVGRASVRNRRRAGSWAWSNGVIDVSRRGRVNLFPLLKVRAAKMASSWGGLAVGTANRRQATYTSPVRGSTDATTPWLARLVPSFSLSGRLHDSPQSSDRENMTSAWVSP